MSGAIAVLCVDKVHVWRGDRHVLRGVSFNIGAGELVHVTGSNGSGKTTLLRVACGLLRPEQGSVCWQGTPITATRSEYQSAVAYASHEPALKADLTVLENLQFMIGLRRRISLNALPPYLRRTGVEHCASLPVRALSAGQRRRVALARVLASHATLWLLDEPYTNLDSAGSSLLSGLLAEHIEAGGSAVVVAHHELEVATRARPLMLSS